MIIIIIGILVLLQTDLTAIGVLLIIQGFIRLVNNTIKLIENKKSKKL